MKLIAAVSIALVLFGSQVYAQEVKKVPYGTARFYWDPPASLPDVGMPSWYILNCGGPDIRIDAPAVSYPVKDAVRPGKSTCTLRAANDFGASESASFPIFDAGNKPSKADNLRVESPGQAAKR